MCEYSNSFLASTLSKTILVMWQVYHFVILICMSLINNLHVSDNNFICLLETFHEVPSWDFCPLKNRLRAKNKKSEKEAFNIMLYSDMLLNTKDQSAGITRKWQKWDCEERKAHLRKWHQSADLHEMCYGRKRKIWIKHMKQRNCKCKGLEELDKEVFKFLYKLSAYEGR